MPALIRPKLAAFSDAGRRADGMVSSITGEKMVFRGAGWNKPEVVFRDADRRGRRRGG